MKNLNVLKLFLVTILAIGWIVAIDAVLNGVIKKEGHETFVETMYATPDCLKVDVWDQEQTDPYENYLKLVEKYEGQEGIICVSPTHDWLDFSSVELEEATGRSVYLEGRVYEEMIVRALAGEAPQELQEYEVLLPKYFTPCGIGGYQGKTYMDGDEWIGKTISAMYNASRSDAKWDKTQSITLITKKQEDVNAIAKESGLSPLVSGREESSLYVFFMAGLKGGAIFLFVVALVNIVLTLTEEIRERRSEIGLLCALGYENGRIGMMLLWELIIIIGIVICCVVIFSCVFVPMGNRCIDELVGTVYQQVRIEMDIRNLAKVLGVSVVAMLAGFAAVYYKMEQVNTIEVLKETPQI